MKSWRVTWHVDTLTPENMTAGEAVAFQALAGVGWEGLQNPMLSPVTLVSLFTVAAARSYPSLDDAAKEVHATALRDLMNALDEVEVS